MYGTWKEITNVCSLFIHKVHSLGERTKQKRRKNTKINIAIVHYNVYFVNNYVEHTFATSNPLKIMMQEHG